ncbi:MAG: RDD family protein [Candidatus Kapaibacteriales bacterium]
MQTCERCGKSYPSSYYFATPTICKHCFEKLSLEEKQTLQKLSYEFLSNQSIAMRVGFGKRFLSAFIDSLVIITIVIVVYKFNGFIETYLNFINEIREYAIDQATITALQNEFFRDNKWNFLYPSILALIYYLSEILWGVSLGKYLLGLKIANSNGSYSSSLTLLIRYIVKNSTSFIGIIWIFTNLSFLNALNSLVGLVILFGFLLILTRRRQDLQDLIAKTAVFRADELKEYNNKIEQ